MSPCVFTSTWISILRKRQPKIFIPLILFIWKYWSGIMTNYITHGWTGYIQKSPVSAMDRFKARYGELGKDLWHMLGIKNATNRKWDKLPPNDPRVMPWEKSHIDLVGPWIEQFRVTRKKFKQQILHLMFLNAATSWLENIYIKNKRS